MALTRSLRAICVLRSAVTAAMLLCAASSNAMPAINPPVSVDSPSTQQSSQNASQSFNQKVVQKSQSKAGVNSEPEKKVLIFWASWCGYCKGALKQFDTAEADGRLAGYKAVAVNIFDKNIDPSKFLNQLNVSLPSETATSFLEAARGVKVLPWVVLLDDEGQIIAGQRPQKSVNGNEQWIEMMSSMHQSLRPDSYVLEERMNEPSNEISSLESQTLQQPVALSFNESR